MKRFGLILSGLALIFALVYLSPALAQEEYPGAFYFGDGDCDGTISPIDNSFVKAVTRGLGESLSGLVYSRYGFQVPDRLLERLQLLCHSCRPPGHCQRPLGLVDVALIQGQETELDPGPLVGRIYFNRFL